MRFNTRMPAGLRPYFQSELEEYRKQLAAGDSPAAWRHLERAHIIGQAYPWQHTYVHWRMLVFGLRNRNAKEVIGQIPRLLVGGAMSFVNNYPTGNTGGANVPALQHMKIEADLVAVLEQAGVDSYD